MKKLLVPFLLSLLFVGSASAYVVKKGDSLWRIARENKTTVESLKQENSLTSNLIKVGQQLNVEQSLGASIPVVLSLFQTSLQSAITSSATSMTLVLGTDRQGTTLSGFMCFTLDSGTAQAEYACGTVAGTAVTGLTRGIDPITGTTAVVALQFAHRRGADVRVTDFPVLTILARLLNGNDSIPSIMYYTNTNSFTTSTQIVSKAYVDGVAISGAPNAANGVKGIVESGTALQIASSTPLGTTGALLFAPSTLTTSSPYTAGKYIPVTQNNGKLDPLFIDQTNNYTWSGNHTFSSPHLITASTTLTSNTQFGGRIQASSTMQQDGTYTNLGSGTSTYYGNLAVDYIGVTSTEAGANATTTVFNNVKIKGNFDLDGLDYSGIKWQYISSESSTTTANFTSTIPAGAKAGIYSMMCRDSDSHDSVDTATYFLNGYNTDTLTINLHQAGGGVVGYCQFSNAFNNPEGWFRSTCTAVGTTVTCRSANAIYYYK